LPGLAVGHGGEPGLRFGVADDFFFFCVPPDGAAQIVGDVTQMAGGDGAMAGFGGGDAWLAGFYAVQEVTGVVGGDVGFPRTSVEFLLQPVVVRCFDVAASYFHPTVFADPFETGPKFWTDRGLDFTRVLTADF